MLEQRYKSMRQITLMHVRPYRATVSIDYNFCSFCVISTDSVRRQQV